MYIYIYMYTHICFVIPPSLLEMPPIQNVKTAFNSGLDLGVQLAGHMNSYVQEPSLLHARLPVHEGKSGGEQQNKCV